MPTYDTVREYFNDDPKNNDGVISVNPHWLICVIGLADPLTFSRSKKGSIRNKVDATVSMARNKLIIANDCISMNITNSKGTHTKSMQATLRIGKINYIKSILSGDWIMAWCVNSRQDLIDLIDKVKNGNEANDFYDGLKFIGRVNSFSKSMELSSDGHKSTTYNLDAYGFRELDSSMFFDQHFSTLPMSDQKSGYLWLQRIGLDITRLFGTMKGGVADNNCRHLIANLLKILIGKGVPSSEINSTPQLGTAAAGLLSGSGEGEAPYAYLVPQEVGDLLGKVHDNADRFFQPSKKSAILSYADLMELYTGVQDYKTESDTYSCFLPYTDFRDGFENFSGQENLGCFIVNYSSFTNRPVWNILEQYINPEVNELYTCLRVNAQGKIVPQVIFRQIPFTTPALAKILNKELADYKKSKEVADENTAFEPLEVSQGDSAADENTKFDIVEVKQGDSSAANGESEYVVTNVTPFHNLPRWKIDDAMVKSVRIGRTDGMRANLVHIYGQTAMLNKGNVPTTFQMVANPPIVDGLDIQRSGMRLHMATVACFNTGQLGKSPSSWMELVADRCIGSQMTLNGNITTTGIQAPICEGDNLEWNGLLFHIESVIHSCSISGDGEKSFTTSMTLSNGVLSDNFDPAADTDPVNSFYAGLGNDPSSKNDPGLTIETDFDGDIL